MYGDDDVSKNDWGWVQSNISKQTQINQLCLAQDILYSMMSFGCVIIILLTKNEY